MCIVLTNALDFPFFIVLLMIAIYVAQGRV
jgi:hypothetical protein